MMRRVWAAVAATWALLAIVAVLAWSHPVHPAPVAGGASVVMLNTKGKPGKVRVVLLHGGAPAVTTTHSSPPAAGR